MSFDTMSKICPDEMKVEKFRLVCYVCEYGRHTRTSYVCRGLRMLRYVSSMCKSRATVGLGICGGLGVGVEHV